MNYHVLGIMVGVLCGLLVVFIASAIIKDKSKKEYDERQQLLQGKANKAGMWTALSGCAIVGLSGEFGAKFCSIGIAMFMVIAVSVMVYVVVAIHYDAYISFKADMKKQYGTFILLFLVMVMNLVSTISRDGLFKDGMMTTAWLFVMAVLMYVVLFIALFVHNRKGTAEESEEE